jgi:hypothetical protein
MSWRSLVGLEEQTAAEKRAALNGVSLFFGALIGANLGATEQMALRDYALIIAIMCLIVLYIHLASVTRKRWSNMAHLLALLGGLYLLLIHEAGTLVFEGPRPTAHIFVTICFWLASIFVVEVRPVSVTAPVTPRDVPAGEKPALS